MSPTRPRLPQGKHWVTVLHHLHMRRDHDFPFRYVRDVGEDGYLGFYDVELPPVPNCRVRWDGHPAPTPLIFQWVAGEKHFSEYNLPFLISDKEHRPADMYSLTRIEWLRLAEIALWKVYEYPVRDLYGVDWTAREAEWRHGREPRTRLLKGRRADLQLPVNPCELITSDIDFRI